MSRISECSKRTTRSQSRLEEIAEDRQVPIDKLDANELTLRPVNDSDSCRFSIDRHSKKTSSVKLDVFDARSMSNNMQNLNLLTQFDMEDESDRLALEAKIMKRRAEYMERRSLALKESSQGLENPHSVGNGAADGEYDKQKAEPDSIDNRDRISRFLSDCEQHSASKLPVVVEAVPVRRDHSNHVRVSNNGKSSFDLPKIELTKFGGNASEYWNFMRQFETHVERREIDDDQRLLYLLNYCYGEAKEAIIGCSILPANEGYKEAKALLKRLFGRSYIISRKIIDEVLSFPKIQKYDDKALTKLYVKMSTGWKTLSQMNYMADINSVATIQRIVDKLPDDLSDRWIRETYSVYESEREPEFLDLIRFIDREAAIAQTRYADKRRTIEGHNANSRIESKGVDKWRAGPGRSVNFVSNAARNKPTVEQCVLCGDDHKLHQCQDYDKLSVNQRWDMAKQKGCCYSCLANGHTVRECKNRNQCGTRGCVRRHHPSLHVDTSVNPPQSKTVCNSLGETDVEVSLGVIPVRIVGPKGSVVIQALLDTGANTTLIHKDVISRLGISGVTTQIKLNTVLEASSITADKCHFTIEAMDSTDRVSVRGAFAVDQLPIKLKASTISRRFKRWPHLDGITIEECNDERVVMIIGCDQPKAHWVLDTRIGSDSQPFAIKTPLGWVLLGPAEANSERVINHIEVNEETTEESLEELTTRLYNKEFEDLCGVAKSLSKEEMIAAEIVEQGTRSVEGRYEVPLPWRCCPPPLVDNREYARKRLYGLKKRFASNPDLVYRYDQIIQDHSRKGYITLLKTETGDGGSWYIPHHPVINPKKPEKLRIVFDCAAKYRGKSINDCLYSGPDTTANLVGVLLRFRKRPVAIMGDIEEMFLQVRLHSKDQNWMRFLWWDGAEIDREPVTYKMVVHPFGATSSPFCANYALRKTIEDNRQALSSVTESIANRCIYVDDCIASVEDVSTARTVINELRKVTSFGGFKLKKWLSNRKEALMDVPLEDLAKNVKLCSKSELPTERTLGIEWDAEGDELRFTFEDLDKPNTRRGLLSTIASTFDPLGLISPLILNAKILLQNLCREKKDWDQMLEGEQLSNWIAWKDRMRKLNSMKFPRCIKENNDCNTKLQLHLFADASEVGYGAVAYIRERNNTGGYSSKLLMSKARVAPLKTVTIPRLELSAAVLATRMGKAICNEWDESFESVHFWVDSIIVLRYLHNTSSRFTTFVANRVQEILELSNVSQWRHVPTEINPADYASRGLPVKEATERDWMEGPGFLKLGEADWPKGLTFPTGDEELELKRGIVLQTTRSNDSSTDRLLEYHSDWYKLLKATAWMRRFFNYLSVMKGKAESLKIGLLSKEEVDQAETSILRYVQRKQYPSEFKSVVERVKDGEAVVWHRSELKKLCPRARKGLMVIDSRLKLASIDDDYKYPIILPKQHPVTNAIIMYHHRKEGHSGTSHILAKVRERYWVIHGGATVRKALRKCLRCRVLNATSMQQQMAPLPTQRVTEGWYPFQHTGIDYFGPFRVKRGRKLERRYGCLFTCLQCRAVHLELAQSLSTDSFILTLVRFINRRGVPKELYSDNGGNFVGAERELKDWICSWDQNKIDNCMLEKRIKWNFNPSSASHRGGIWERLIRSTRKILNSVAWRESLDEELLWTYLTEAERIINDRPLTAVRDGTSEPRPLRPSDLLQHKGGERIVMTMPIGQLIEKRWRLMNGLVAEFWKRWKTEYLAALQERQKWTRICKEIAKGDIVITEVESTPRTWWPLGVVEEIVPDGDGLVRTVVVRTAGGLIRRDIRKVYRLEGEE